MIACFGPATSVAFALFFILALVLMRLGVPRDTAATPAAGPPYDWEQEGL